MRVTGRPRSSSEAVAEDNDGNPIVFTAEDETLMFQEFDRIIALAKGG